MRRLVLLSAFLPLLAACTTSPVTGQKIFTGIVSEQEEENIGRQQHADILKQFGGVSDNAKLNEFVAGIGVRLAPQAERKNVRWTFTVLDDDMVNAFAVPGGYIYITRGLLNLAQDESQVAAVLAHEMGHINARHSAQQMSQGLLANIGLQAIGIAVGGGAAQAGSIGADLYIKKYSRTHEFEADSLGVKYLAGAGYDPYAEEKFLAMLQRNSDLEGQMSGQPNAPQLALLSTHPLTPERVTRAGALADQIVTVKNPTINRAGYLRVIDGTVYGDAASQGFIRGQEFIHPELKIRFAAPNGFTLKNSPKQVVAENKSGAAMIFDTARANVTDPALFITGAWAQGAELSGQERITINGMQAATAATTLISNQGVKDARLVAISGGEGKYYRLMFVAPKGQMGNYAEAFRRATYSFVRDAKIADVDPNRVRVVTVKAGETVQSLAAKMPVPDFKVERFCLLNGITPETKLSTGELIKTVQ
jgi:predicted Zn-dependent protease